MSRRIRSCHRSQRKSTLKQRPSNQVPHVEHLTTSLPKEGVSTALRAVELWEWEKVVNLGFADGVNEGRGRDGTKDGGIDIMRDVWRGVN